MPVENSGVAKVIDTSTIPSTTDSTLEQDLLNSADRISGGGGQPLGDVASRAAGILHDAPAETLDSEVVKLIGSIMHSLLGN